MMTFKEFAELSYMVEGLEVDYENKIVSINNSHNKGQSSLLHYQIKGMEVYSIFKRLSGHGDGNPLIKSLKNIDNWSLSHTDKDYVDSQIKNLSSTLNYDTVVMVASSNQFNHHIVDLLKGKVIKDLFEKLEADEVQLECSSGFTDKERTQLTLAYDKMQRLNKGIFSFKFIPKELRNRFSKCSTISSTNYSEFIDDKDILIVDDTVTSGSTMSQSIEALLGIYQPKSVKVLTVFSKLYKS